ncbi:MAG: lipopolysaccharide heptosyltransferase family protein [Chloroflexi bacterium]|nr:MAG: lipopolysaccharide heptosyltransferase family protein [Chloroflexota bacterium]
MEYGIIPGVKKIAVLRALVLGDLIFVLPALEALHHAYPQAEIVYVARAWTADFVLGRIPGISQVIGIRPAPADYEDLGFLIHPEDAAWLFPQMEAEHPDIAISMQGGGKNSNPLVRRLGARVSIGSLESGATPLDRCIPYDYYQNDVIRNLDLVGLAGAQPRGWVPRLPLLDTDREAAAPFLAQIDRPYVVIHSGARDIRRMWPPEKFAVVANAIKRKLGMEIILTGSAVDAKAAFQVENAMKKNAVNLSHQLSLPALTGVLANAELIISNDTGVLHLGLAVGTKAVGLYWGEYISKSMPLSRDSFYPLIAWERRCPLCGLFLDRKEVVRADPRPCMHQVSFISSITPKQVLDAAERMLTYQ